MSLDILMLVQGDCAFCDRAHEILDRLQREYPLSVRIVDIDSDEGHTQAQEGGVMFAPGVFIEGSPFSYGRLSERKLRKELDSLLQRV